MYNLLDAKIIELFFDGANVSMNWIAKLIAGLVSAIGIVGIGVIVFTLILKCITLPLDIYSKASMRKNSLKMEKMRPQLEKLQKQYADNQQMYNQKMMEMYKKNGYSMFGACLPMIVSLVVFIVVLNAFSSFAKNQELSLFNKMANDYSAAVLEYAPDEFNPTVTFSEPEEISDKDKDGNTQYKIIRTATYKADGKYISFIETQTVITTDRNINVEEIDFTDTKTYPVSTVYYVETSVMMNDAEISNDLKTLKEEYINSVKKENESIENEEEKIPETISDDDLCALYMKTIGRKAAEQSYYENRVGFLWVKNIWYPDTAFNHPLKSYSGLKSSVGFKGNKNYIDETFYNEIIYNIKGEMKEPNGYFILIALSIGTMFLSQFIMSKSQKAQNELQTVDGQGAKTQKMMMIIMPVMFGIFSFMYSAAFSIYMIISSVWTILSTLAINYFINKKYKKLEEKELQEKYNRRIPYRNASDYKRSNKKR